MSESMKFAVTRERLEEARKRLSEAGFPIVGDKGEVSQKGFRVGYEFVNGKLTLTLLKKPFLVPASMVRNEVRKKLIAEGIFEV